MVVLKSIKKQVVRNAERKKSGELTANQIQKYQ